MKTLLDGIFSEGLPGLTKTLDLTWKRNSAIASNIANVETPGYRAADLDFGHELEKAFERQGSPLAMTNKGHMDVKAHSGSHLTPDLSGATKPDGNNVDLDIQMGQLAYNKGKYAMAANLVRKKFALLASAIRSTQ